jgi:Protein of unknown function
MPNFQGLFYNLHTGDTLESRSEMRKEQTEGTHSLSDSEIDEAILSVTVTFWRKVALVIASAREILGNTVPNDEAGLDLIAKRIEALTHDGRLSSQGDIKKWRFSEVRKPE